MLYFISFSSVRFNLTRLSLIPSVAALSLGLFLSACVTTPADFEDPAVSVISFTPLNSASITPRFEIVLHITNPNREPLELEGISYSIQLDGNEIISGVANDLPVIEAYGEADVKLNAHASLLGGFQLFSGLMNEPKEHIEYEFKAKLDLGNFMPLIRVSKKGML